MTASYPTCSNVSSWLLSLMLLFSVIGFSGSTLCKIDQKQTETAVNVSGKHLAKKGVSFNRLRSDLISKGFIGSLNNLSIACSGNHLNSSLATFLKAGVANFNSIQTPDDLIRNLYRARSADDLSNAG